MNEKVEPNVLVPNVLAKVKVFSDIILPAMVHCLPIFAPSCFDLQGRRGRHTTASRRRRQLL